MTSWPVHARVLVQFQVDPALWHERRVLRVTPGGMQLVVTPDRDLEWTNLNDKGIYTGVMEWEQGRLPAGISTKKVYLAKHGKGIFNEGEINELVLRGSRIVAPGDVKHKLYGKQGPTSMPGPPLPPPEEDAPSEKVESDSGGVFALPEDRGMQWVVLGGTVVHPHGSIVSGAAEAETAIHAGHFLGFFKDKNNDLVICEQVGDAMVENFQAEIKLASGDVPAVEEDVRVLPVTFDAGDERWKSLEDAVPLYYEEDFEDYPLGGPRTMAHTVRQLKRMSMSFLQQHEAWVRKSGIRSADRAVHEHLAICRCLHLLATYDQVNMPNIAGAEALNRRRALIENAYSGHPESPSYEGSDDFLGIKESSDGTVIDPALSQHVSQRQTARAQIQVANYKAMEARENMKKGRGKYGEEDLSAGVEGGGGKGRGRGKDKGAGRGAAAPAAVP
ncbi:unnamed protein product [Polarella glacialis]|uniref:Uncharacterized protein n=1 Tax=Polarella glacialis TaxID=89957 RepID=A0A813LIK4_POLGL|nr:unnamed protein product [Polarella glacialis]